MDETSMGFKENTAAALSYLLFFVTGILFYYLEKKNRYVKFHALQSMLIFITLFVILIVVGFIPMVGWIFSIMIVPFIFLVWAILMFKAYNGEIYKISYFGTYAENKIEPDRDDMMDQGY